MNFDIADNRIREVWDSLKGKSYTSLSYQQELYIKSNTIKFVKMGFIVIDEKRKSELWDETSQIEDKKERFKAYSVLIYKEYLKNESSRK